jgi:hypothetical protein
MPRGDKSGPQGEGSMTGRGRGKCNSKDRASAPKGQGGKRSGRRAGKGQRQGAGQGIGRSAGREAERGQDKQS